MKKHVLIAGLLAAVLAAGAWAQTDMVDEEALFGGDESATSAAGTPSGSAAALPGADAASDDSLFDTASAVSTASTSAAYEEKFLKSEPVRLGGQFTFSVASGIDWFRDYPDWTGEYFWADPLTKKQDDPADTVNPAGSRRQIEVANPEKREDSRLDLSGNIWFSARPTADLRLFGKAAFAFPFAVDAVSLAGYNKLIDSLNKAGGVQNWFTPNPTDQDGASYLASAAKDAGVALPNIKIWEFYADFGIDDKVFFRVGKQMVKWGVGYFFQPADVISLSAVDVNNPKADREGPLAIKANIPLDVHNLDFYLIAPGSTNLESVLDLKPAVRFQAVLGGWELGLGATVDDGKNKATILKDGSLQYDRDVQAKFIATASGSIWDFNVFAEGLVQRYQPGLYLADGSFSYVNSSFTHTIAINRDQWLFSGTAGLSYSNADAYFNGLAQYYFNGAGYDNLGSAVADALGYIKAANDPAYNPQNGKVSVSDLSALALGFTGKHYLGVNLGESFAKNSKVSASAFLLWNISDLSGYVRPGVSIKLTDQINLGINSTIYFGADNTQFRGIKKALVDAGSFFAPYADSFQQPRFKLGLTLDMGSGAF